MKSAARIKNTIEERVERAVDLQVKIDTLSTELQEIKTYLTAYGEALAAKDPHAELRFVAKNGEALVITPKEDRISLPKEDKEIEKLVEALGNLAPMCMEKVWKLDTTGMRTVLGKLDIKQRKAVLKHLVQSRGTAYTKIQVYAKESKK